jgi:hypothetical protein
VKSILNDQGEVQVNTPAATKKIKRPSKGLRKHNRKVKQENRKAYVPTSDAKKKSS